MASRFMSLEEFSATRHALQEANDLATLLSLAQRLARQYPNDPEAKRLMIEIAAKRERLAAPSRQPSPSST